MLLGTRRDAAPRELINLLPASSLQHPRNEPVRVAPRQRGIAQQLSFPVLHQVMLLWLQGLALGQHSLPSVNPGNPPPQHTRGRSHHHAVCKCSPPAQLGSCTAPGAAMHRPRTSLHWHSKRHQHLLSKQHHERPFEAEQQRVAPGHFGSRWTQRGQRPGNRGGRLRGGKRESNHSGLLFSRNFCGGIQNSITCWERS